MAAADPRAGGTTGRGSGAQGLISEMAKLDTSLDRQQPGPKRLELLRRQTSVSDEFEPLRLGRT